MSSKNDTSGKAANTRTVRFNVKRCDGPGKPTRWERFDVPVQSSSAGSGSANVISCLQWIAANPVTVEGKKTTPVSFDCGCLEEVCGACTMVINGKVRQSCSCLMDDYAPNDGDEITLEPMSKFPVNRDLFVDRSRLFNDLERIKGWVPIDGTYDLGAGPRETPEQQQQRFHRQVALADGPAQAPGGVGLLADHDDGAAPAVVGRLGDGNALVGDRLPRVATEVEQASQLRRRRVGVDEQWFHRQITRWGGSG